MYERGGDDPTYGYGSGSTGNGHPGAYMANSPSGPAPGYEAGWSDYPTTQWSGSDYPTTQAPASALAGDPDPHVRYRSPSGESYPDPVDVTAGPHAYDPIADPAAAGFEPIDPTAGYPMRNGAGRAALWFGVIALICTTALFVLFPLGVVFGVAAIVLGRRGRFRARYGFATNGGSASAGLALGTASVLIGVLLAATAAWLVTAYDLGAARECISDSSSGPQAIRCLADVVEAG